MSARRKDQPASTPCPWCDGTGYLAAEKIHIGIRIMQRRKVLGMTQEALSEAVRKSRGQVANIETGRSDIPVSMLLLFAEALDCKPSDLVP